MLKRIEVVTYDVVTGLPVVDHMWKVARHHGKRKFAKLMRRVNHWADQAAKADNDADHAVYVRSL